MKLYIFPLTTMAAGVLGRACHAVRPSTSVSIPAPPPQSTAPAPIVVPTKTQAPVQPPAPTTTLVTSVSKAPQQPTSTPPATSPPVSDNSGSESGPTVSGKSTFYGGNLSGGTCMFTDYTLPAGMFGTAFSGQVWNNAANCGRCVKVTGPNGKTITAMIVDQCPECAESHLDLFQNAFEQIGEISAGIIQTSYQFVDCGITTPFFLRNKSGTSPYWFSMQVVGATEGVASLEVSTNGGSSWTSTQRKDYNFFEYQSGFGTDKVDVRVTSQSGKVVTVKNVGVASDSKTDAPSNF